MMYSEWKNTLSFGCQSVESTVAKVSDMCQRAELELLNKILHNLLEREYIEMTI